MTSDFEVEYNAETNKVELIEIDCETKQELHRWPLTADEARAIAAEIEQHLLDNHQEEWIAAMVAELDKGVTFDA